MADTTLGKLKVPADYDLTDFTEVHFDAEDGVSIIIRPQTFDREEQLGGLDGVKNCVLT